MRHRVVLVSKDETVGFTKYFGIGIPPENIIVLSRVNPKDEFPIITDKSQEAIIKNLGDGDGVLLADKDSFGYLRQFYHFGIRSENFFDCSKLPRLSIEGGAFVKCIYEELPTTEEINYFISDDFCKHQDFSWFKQKVLHTVEDSINMINYFDSLPENTNYGFDYEASGMPLDIQFEISGASICTTQFGGFISFTDCRHNNTKEQYQFLLKRLGEFLEKRQSQIWVYNMQYEFQVSHRVLGVTLYDLCDASTINVLDGNHLKKYSLKWTAQNILGATVWDTEFDRISDLIENMLFTIEGKLKKEKRRVLKVDQNTYKNTPEWAELCKRYPSYIHEFESLILEYWGNEFMCIPSDILGYYCNLDSFYTLMIYETKKNEYTQDAFQTFLDNNRLGCLLHSSGLYIDEEFRVRYHDESLKMMAWGITYCATARCFVKMEKHRKKMAKLSSYNSVCQKLLKINKFFGGDALEITKHILSTHIDTMDAYNMGLDEGSLLMDYGMEFAENFIDIVKDSMTETKYKGKIDSGIIKKKKILGVISQKIVPLLGLDNLPKPEKQLELEKYLYYERAYNELLNISKNYLFDINNIPEKIKLFGDEVDLQTYSDYISDNYFKCKSPIENDEICLEFAKLYPCETSYLAAVLESTQQLENAEKFYSTLGINTIEGAYNHFAESYEKYLNSSNVGEYPLKIYNLAKGFFDEITKKSIISEQTKNVWSNFEGFIAQEQFFKYISEQYLNYSEPFKVVDFTNNFGFIRKFVINYLLYKKYSKVLSTYIDGMFKANNRYVIEGPDRIPLRYAISPDEPGAVEKCFVHYEINTKSSKRWSSGFHTIISHGDIKHCIVTPPSYDENGNIIYGGADYLLSYFDISSAEVKAATFASLDKDLIKTIEDGNDIYIYTAKIYLGDKWDTLDKKTQKAWRKKFKTIFLGVMYGLGRAALAQRLNCSEEESDKIIQGLYKNFPTLRKYVESQQNYPLSHDGYINTFLGDKLQIQEWKYYLKASSQRDKNNQEARIKRLGVNLPIQGGTSSINKIVPYNSNII